MGLCSLTSWLIPNFITKDNFKLCGKTTHARTYGQAPNISNLTWGLYKWWYYRDNESFPYPQNVLGRVLGSSKNEVIFLVQYVLNINSDVLPRRTLRWQAINPEWEWGTQALRIWSAQAIHQTLGNSYLLAPPVPDNKLLSKFKEAANNEVLKQELTYYFEGEESSPYVSVADLLDATGKSITDHIIDQKSFTNTLLGAKVGMSRRDGQSGLCKVIKQARNPDGK